MTVCCILQIIVVSWILGTCIIGINIYYLSTAFVGWIIHNSLPKVANVFIGIIVFPFMALYIVSVLYLTFRKDTEVTFIDSSDSVEIEKGVHNRSTEVVPYREDLSDIPFPQ